MDDLEKELKVCFIGEAQQLLQDAEQCFLQIESSPDDPQIIDQLFRLAHNLKGSAKAVGFAELGAFTHLIESLLLKIKNAEIRVQSHIVNLLLACNDQLQVMLEGLTKDLNASFDCSALSDRLREAIENKIAPTEVVAAEIAETEVAETSDSSEEPEHEIDELSMPSADSAGFAESDERLALDDLKNHDESGGEFEGRLAEVALHGRADNTDVKQSSSGPADHGLKMIPPVAEQTKTADKQKVASAPDESIRVSLARVDQLINFVGEMVILQSVLFEQAYSENITAVRKTVHQLGKISKELQDVSMSLRMVPLKQTFQKMQRIVRDTSQSLDKKVNLVLQGEETEVEKTVLELIGDPLVHLIRNAVDHGIDTAEERASSGKTDFGTITLKAYHQADSIVLEVHDDGKGIDGNRLKEKAIEKNIIKAGQVLTEKQTLNLIFHPGFSTKQNVSDISGRGVGLDVVKTNIERLQGTVEVFTELGRGSKFRIQLPLTLAIIDATTVKLNDQRYAIPMSHIHESVQVKESDLQLSVNMGEIITLRGENLRVYRLNQLLGIKETSATPANIMLISRVDDQAFGILVHDISSMQQIVVKKLSPEISKLVGVSGSAILGDGKPALILDLPRLITVPQTKTVARVPAHHPRSIA